jgi:hypothetical protein
MSHSYSVGTETIDIADSVFGIDSWTEKRPPNY